MADVNDAVDSAGVVITQGAAASYAGQAGKVLQIIYRGREHAKNNAGDSVVIVPGTGYVLFKADAADGIEAQVPAAAVTLT